MFFNSINLFNLFVLLLLLSFDILTVDLFVHLLKLNVPPALCHLSFCWVVPGVDGWEPRRQLFLGYTRRDDDRPVELFWGSMFFKRLKPPGAVAKGAFWDLEDYFFSVFHVLGTQEFWKMVDWKIARIFIFYNLVGRRVTYELKS